MKPANNAPVYCAIYAGLAEIARSFGYALTIHGSMARDFDIVAVPWAKEIGTPQQVVDAICEKYAVTMTPGDPAVMNHGRICYNLALMGEFYFDVSFIPVNLDAAIKLRDALDRSLTLIEKIRSGDSVEDSRIEELKAIKSEKF
jgi:hypothetical protein